MIAMLRVTIDEFKSDLPRYLEQVAQGETIELVQNDHAVAEVRPVPVPSRHRRPIGLAKGAFEVPQSFFDPLPEDLTRAFNGEDE